MAQRRITRRAIVVALAGTGLALAIAGCASPGEQTATWHAGAAQTAGGQGGGTAAGHTMGTGNPGTGKPPAPGPGPTRTSPAPATPASGSPSSPTTPASGPGAGPAGSITSTGTDAVALTFDDGPGPYTGQMLDLLAKYHVKATFCVIGRQVQAYAEEIRRMVADGHTLCNHTWDHDEELRTRSDDVIDSELQRTNDAIHAVAPDAKIKYFRNPGGNFAPNTVAAAARLGMISLMWNVDPRDWAHPGVQTIIDNVVAHTQPGSVVLSHDGGGDRSDTLAAYRSLLPDLTSRVNLIAMPVS